MSNANLRFSNIESRAVMPNGKIITRIVSSPEGLTKAEYDKIDRDMVTAFGNDGTSTVGTPMPQVSSTNLPQCHSGL